LWWLESRNGGLLETNRPPYLVLQRINNPDELTKGQRENVQVRGEHPGDSKDLQSRRDTVVFLLDL
jgi:hypothetical protein